MTNNNIMTKFDKYKSITEFAELIGKKPEQVHQWTTPQKIDPIIIGGKKFIDIVTTGKVTKQIFAIIFGIFKPYFAITMFAAEFTHFVFLFPVVVGCSGWKSFSLVYTILTKLQALFHHVADPQRLLYRG